MPLQGMVVRGMAYCPPITQKLYQFKIWPGCRQKPSFYMTKQFGVGGNLMLQGLKDLFVREIKALFVIQCDFFFYTIMLYTKLCKPSQICLPINFYLFLPHHLSHSQS
jgi:hypothetical protein